MEAAEHRPGRLVTARFTTRTVAVSLGVGALCAYLWSFRLVDWVIGTNGTTALIGHDAARVDLTGGAMAVAFAAASGLAGSFTACNVAAFGTLGPLCARRGADVSARSALGAFGWLALGATAVAAAYGAVGAAVGPTMPQVSGALVGSYPASLLQATVVFGVLGAVFVWFGLGAAGLIADPLARVGARSPRLPPLILGAVVGAFLVGRPFPLFLKLFAYAADRRNVALGAVAFVAQIWGNLALVGAITLAAASRPGIRYRRWLAARPHRSQQVAAAALLVAGSFTFLYWVVRVPAALGHGWWPAVPWN